LFAVTQSRNDPLSLHPDLNVCQASADPLWTLHPTKRRVAQAVGRRLVPTLIEATLIPTVLFYSTLGTTRSLGWALVVIVGWSYSAVLRRLLSGRPVPALLFLASIGITVRTVVFLLSGNAFIYFAQPILGTVVTATVFGGSCALGRPLIARFAGDFCELSNDVRSRPAISLLFHRLTLLWAGVNLASAAVSITVLLTVPVTVFVGVRTIATWALIVTGLLVTVSASVRVARDEGIVTWVGPNGTLRAVAVSIGD
jgi:hypothetical protein